MSTDAKTESAGTSAGAGAPVAPGTPAHAVGRASVPGDGKTRYVRPPGMNPPPLSPQDLPGAPGTAVTGPGRPSVADAVRVARQAVSSAASRGPRRARLVLKRVDPWSVMKFSMAVALVLFIVLIVATSVLYVALDAMGVFDSVNETLGSLIGGTGSINIQITAKGVIGAAAIFGFVNMVLFTAMSTLGAFIYNVCADLVGGIEVTLSEKD